MKFKGDKLKIYIIIAVVGICIIGILFYTFNFSSKPVKKPTAATEKKKEFINLKNVKDKISMGNVKTIKGETSVCGIYDDNNYILNDGTSIVIKNKKNNNAEEIIKLDKEVGVSFDGVYKDNIVFSILSIRTYDNQQYGMTTIYIYNRKNKKTKKIKENILKKQSDGDYIYTLRLLDYIQVHDNNIIYASDCSDDGSSYSIYDYDMDADSEKKIYSEKSDNFYLGFFDVDMNSGYIVCELYNGMAENEHYLKLINIKKNRSRILAKSENMFNLFLNYPNVIFNLDDKIHIYDINESADDECISCDDTINGMEVYKDKLFIELQDIYCYSFKDKSLKKITYPSEYNNKIVGIRVMDGKLCWFNENTIYYMDISK